MSVVCAVALVGLESWIGGGDILELGWDGPLPLQDLEIEVCALFLLGFIGGIA